MNMYSRSGLEKVVGLTGIVIIHVSIASFSPVQGERNQMLNAKFTRPVNAMPMSSSNTLLSLKGWLPRHPCPEKNLLLQTKMGPDISPHRSLIRELVVLLPFSSLYLIFIGLQTFAWEDERREGQSS